MKLFSEIRRDKRFQPKQSGEDGGNGWITLHGKTFFAVYSNGGDWDHVSVSHKSRCPTWDEMCEIKDIFFDEDECCVEYHPAKSNYVNIHPYCLHIWKPQKEQIPVPPTNYV